MCLAIGLHWALGQERRAVPDGPPSAKIGRWMPFALRCPGRALGEKADLRSPISCYAWRTAVAHGLELWP